MKCGLLLLGCLALMLCGEAVGETSLLELEDVEAVDGLQIADLNRDEIPDLLLLQGRLLRVWYGRKGALPAPRLSWKRTLPAGVNFVDVSNFGPPNVVAMGADGIQTLYVDGKPDAPGGAVPWMGWHGAKGPVFADVHRWNGLLHPQDDGWLFDAVPDLPISMKLTRYMDVRSPGPFLEDTCTVLQALPAVFVGKSAAPYDNRNLALWAIDGRTLVAWEESSRVTYDLAFLSAESGAVFDQRLIDLDGDERPDLLHRIHTNRETRYGFFRTKPAEKGAKTGPSHKPATSTLFLSGFQLEPDLVDLDGDGLLDLVVTSMQINAPNMMGALMSGRVTAETRAFLNRWRKGEGTFFDSKPDAVVKSQIGVKVQFNYAGNIEVIRSFTILLDGDFNGDGRKDLAIRTAPDELTLRLGVKTGVWADGKSTVTLKIPPKGKHPDIDGYTADLDGDGKDEIVLVYRKPLGGKDRVRIVDPDL